MCWASIDRKRFSKIERIKAKERAPVGRSDWNRNICQLSNVFMFNEITLLITLIDYENWTNIQWIGNVLSSHQVSFIKTDLLQARAKNKHKQNQQHVWVAPFFFLFRYWNGFFLVWNVVISVHSVGNQRFLNVM